MWGEIENKKIKSIKENYCLGEACLIFSYENAERIIAFKTKEDLKNTLSIFKQKNNINSIYKKDNSLYIIFNNNNNNIIINTTNNKQLDRLYNIIYNYINI